MLEQGLRRVGKKTDQESVMGPLSSDDSKEEIRVSIIAVKTETVRHLVLIWLGSD